MLTIRRGADRGHLNYGWLDTLHTFSFGEYYDPRFMGFRDLRVINEDRVQPGQGFPTHPHRDMEIITCVLEGALEHRDSMGNGSVIRAGDVQVMSAGKGVTHSEYNASREEPVHLLQIWIRTAEKGAAPRYDQKSFSADEKKGRLRLVVSPHGAGGTLRILQDARLYLALLDEGEGLTHELGPERHAWVQVARGEVLVNGERLRAGDGAALSQETRVHLAAVERAELLLFDLP